MKASHLESTAECDTFGIARLGLQVRRLGPVERIVSVADSMHGKMCMQSARVLGSVLCISAYLSLNVAADSFDARSVTAIWTTNEHLRVTRNSLDHRHNEWIISNNETSDSISLMDPVDRRIEPARVHLLHDSLAVLWMSDQYLHVIDLPARIVRSVHIDSHDIIPVSAHTVVPSHELTAAQWSSIIYTLLENDQPKYVCVRMWDGKTLTYQLPELTRVELSAKSESERKLRETEVIVETLESFTKNYREGKYRHNTASVGMEEEFSQAVSAALAAGQLQIRESVPLLREFSQLDIGTGGGVDIRGINVNGNRSIYSIGLYRGISAAHLSLRRLGEKIEGIPSTRFYLPREIAFDQVMHIPKVGDVTTDDILDVQLLATPVDVLTRLGYPDFMFSDARRVVEDDSRSWEYDFVREESFTVEILWSPRDDQVDRRVIGLLYLPPAWTRSTIRDSEVVFRHLQLERTDEGVYIPLRGREIGE